MPVFIRDAPAFVKEGPLSEALRKLQDVSEASGSGSTWIRCAIEQESEDQMTSPKQYKPGPAIGDKVKIKRTTEDCSGLRGEVVKISEIGYGIAFDEGKPKGVLWFRRDEFDLISQ